MKPKTGMRRVKSKGGPRWVHTDATDVRAQKLMQLEQAGIKQWRQRRNAAQKRLLPQDFRKWEVAEFAKWQARKTARIAAEMQKFDMKKSGMAEWT